MVLTDNTIEHWGASLLTLTAQLLQAHGLPTPVHVLAPVCVTPDADSSPNLVTELLEQFEFETCTVELPAEKLAEVPLPAFTYLEGPQPQVVLLEQFSETHCTYIHPIEGRITIAPATFLAQWLRVCVLAMPTDGTAQKLYYDPQQVEAAKAAYRNRLIYQDNFLTDEEVNTLLSLADGKYAPTTNTVKGYFENDVAMVTNNFDAPLQAIMKKALALLPLEATYHPDKDWLAVVSYNEGMLCKPHYDAYYSDDHNDPHNPSKMFLWTIILYLTDDYEGGETAFPHINHVVRGKKGGVLCFPDVDATGGIAPYALHEGRQITKGNKKICTFWLRPHNLVHQ